MIAYLLAIYRMLSGRAWTRDTERRLSRGQWNEGDEGCVGGSMVFRSGDAPSTNTGTDGSSGVPKVLAAEIVGLGSVEPCPSKFVHSMGR